MVWRHALYFNYRERWSYQQVGFKDLTAGWSDIHLQLLFGGKSNEIPGDQVNHNIKYVDNDGMSHDERAESYIQKMEKVLPVQKLPPEARLGANFTAVDGIQVQY